MGAMSQMWHVVFIGTLVNKIESKKNLPMTQNAYAFRVPPIVTCCGSGGDVAPVVWHTHSLSVCEYSYSRKKKNFKNIPHCVLGSILVLP